MVGRKFRELPPVLARARDRFQAWRRKRRPKTRIPEPLWTLAVKLAGVQGVCRTASALGLDYYALKKRLAAVDERPPATTPAFIELPALHTVEKRCLLELANGVGATLRVQLVGYDAAEIAALSCRLWNTE